MNKVMIIALAAIMMLASPVLGAVITQDVEIRGEVATGDIAYDYSSFAGFWYDLKKNMSSETMSIITSGVDGREIAKGDLVYFCAPQMVSYKSPELKNDPDLGQYKVVGFMASKYIGYDNKTDELVKLLIEWGDSDDTILTMNDPLEFPEGYALYAQQIDLEGGKCILALYKDGEVIDTEVIVEGEAYKYFDDDDVLVFSAFVDTVFRGTDSNIVTIEYIFLRSEDILDIDTGDSFGVMEVKSTSGGITLENDEVVTLDSDSEQDIMDSLYFKIADDSSNLRYYLAKTVSLECPDCPECPELGEYPPCPECEPCPEVTPEIVIEYVNVTSDSADEDTGETTNDTPGFEAVFAIAGLFVVGYLVLRQRE